MRYHTQYRGRKWMYFIGIILLAIMASGCNDPEPEASITSPLVRTFRVTASIPNEEAFTGIVVAKNQSDLSFRVAGKVIQKYVDIGQHVKKGQVLAKIDAADFLSQLNKSKEALLAAKAEQVKAINNEKRFSALVTTGAVSRADYDQAKALAEIAKANLRSAEAQVNIAKNSAQYTQLIADTDGIITDTRFESGEYVSAGQVIFQLAHQGPREARVHLPETQRPQLGSTAKAYFYSNNVTLPATLRLLSEAADPATRTYEANYTLNGSAPPLGSTVTINFGSQLSQDAVGIPITAINNFGQGFGVWCINEAKSEVFWCPVKILQMTRESAVVLDIGLDTLIVSLGAHLLHEGEKVRYHSRLGNSL